MHLYKNQDTETPKKEMKLLFSRNALCFFFYSNIAQIAGIITFIEVQVNLLHISQKL